MTESAHTSATLDRFLAWARDVYGSQWDVSGDYVALRYLASIPDHARISVSTDHGTLTIAWNVIDGVGRGDARFVRTSPELRVALRRYQDAVNGATWTSPGTPDETL